MVGGWHFFPRHAVIRNMILYVLSIRFGSWELEGLRRVKRGGGEIKRWGTLSHLFSPYSLLTCHTRIQYVAGTFAGPAAGSSKGYHRKLDALSMAMRECRCGAFLCRRELLGEGERGGGERPFLCNCGSLLFSLARILIAPFRLIGSLIEKTCSASIRFP